MFTPSFIVSALSVLAITVSAASSNCDRTYTVQAGDTCDSIGASNNASTYQLAAVNPTISTGCTNLVVGQSICLGTTGSDCTSTYAVKASDTCDEIADTYGFNVTLLYTNNPQIDSDCTNIYVGEVLCVANSATVPSAGASNIATSIPATATPASITSSAPASQASDDDDDLPYCDEL